jgi:hypothetical protein
MIVVWPCTCVPFDCTQFLAAWGLFVYAMFDSACSLLRSMSVWMHGPKLSVDIGGYCLPSIDSHTHIRIRRITTL